MDYKPASIWFKGMHATDKKKFEELLKSAWPALERLSEILEDYEKDMQRKVRDPKLMENPRWPEQAAGYIGEERAFAKIKQLVRILND